MTLLFYPRAFSKAHMNGGLLEGANLIKPNAYKAPSKAVSLFVS